jgi:hypothetical protein
MDWNGANAQPQISLSEFEFRQRVNAAEMKGFCHAHLHTLWITTAQVTLCCFLKGFIQVHVSKRAGRNAHAATDAHRFVDHNSRRLWITRYPAHGAGFHAERGFTLLAGANVNSSSFDIHIYKYIRDPAPVSVCLLKQAHLYTAQAGDTPIEFHKYNVHSVRFHDASPN